ncbi:MAG: alpha-hydroxy-acid oxidizing enzyme [Robiginitomaculum sp.]|nr:MAG: alpha-hydroxy-acid oxidizing enzyme [Robiginitomaculum sp.]
MPSLNLVPASTLDYRHLAKKKLPRNLFDYIDGGAYSEATLAANTANFEALHIKQRVMRDVSNIDTSLEILGERWAMPLALAPIGLAGMMARRGEVQAVKAANHANVPFCLSTVSICALEEVASATIQPFWFQLYMMRDRGYVRDLLGRAKSVGVKTLVFTVDLAVVGARYRDVRNGMAGGLSTLGKLRAALEYPLHPAWAFDVGVKGKPHVFGNLSDKVPTAKSVADFKSWVDTQFDPSCTWKDIEWLRAQWDGHLIIKGILNVDDAKSAFAAGADAIVVSNHGGRQLDGVASSISITPRIRNALGDAATIIMDGGVRSGQDVLKARASGADAVLIGRPWVWALAARGQAGLHKLLATFKAEMAVSMALTGATSIVEITDGVLDLGN